MTDGTVGGTHELVAGAGGASDPAGLNPTDIAVVDSEIVFSGLDASGGMGLWVSNGTPAGTHELTGITGADPSGLAPSDLMVLNGEILFRGLDSSGRAGLWVTDGTVAGTHELTGIAEASTTGIGLDPAGFAVYGGAALFSGFDSSGNQELWQTNGSVAGTTEIGPVSGTASMGLSPTDLTAIGMAGPALTAGANASYVTGAAPVTLDPGLSVADATAGSVSAATVSISAGFVLGDTLSVGSPQAGIVSQYNPATGVLTLSGAASLAPYETELELDSLRLRRRHHFEPNGHLVGQRRRQRVRPGDQPRVGQPSPSCGDRGRERQLRRRSDPRRARRRTRRRRCGGF